MSLLAPLWLIALLPWAGVTVYLLWGRRKRADVPFLELWRGPIEGERMRRRMAPPPIALALALVAMLLALLAAAGPVVRQRGGRGGEPITLIIDRGLTMSARTPGIRAYRYQRATSAVLAEIAQTFGPTQDVELFVVPAAPTFPAAGLRMDVSGLTARLASITPTAIDARPALRQLIQQRLTETTGPVIAITDAALGDLGPATTGRVVQVAPREPLRNVAIVRLAARASPKAQLMVRVRNDSDLRRITIAVTGGAQALDVQVDLPPRAAEGNIFIDLPAMPPVVSAELKADDDLPADNRAWLVRESSWPKIEPAVAVGELARLIDLYRTLRPPGPASTTVRITGDVATLGASAGAVIQSRAGTSALTRPTRVAPHAMTAAVQNWSSLDLPIGTSEGPPAGWTPLLWAGDRVLLAVRDAPARQAWVGIDASGWADRPEYVVFWTALFDWLGEGGETFAGHDLNEWSPDWRPVEGMAAPVATPEPGAWPGLYEREDGARRAFNAGTLADTRASAPPSGASPAAADWGSQLRTLAGPMHNKMAWRDLSPILLVLSVACVAGAALTWRRRVAGPILTAPSTARTFTSGLRRHARAEEQHVI